MADPKKAVSENVPGDFFVDTTCIDCDTCRQLAPETFAEAESYSYVFAQPESREQTRRAVIAQLCCPTGSIGGAHGDEITQASDDIPVSLEDGVYYCGFNSPQSYGGNSFFVRHPEGNWLIDSPKFLPHLVSRFEEMGGIAHIFLTHRDDVADAGRYAAEFGAKRIIHRFDLSAEPDSEVAIDWSDNVPYGDDFLIIPTPGHTRGHMVLLYKGRFLFTGDHLAYDPHHKRLIAFSDYCWYSWQEQTASMEKLLRLTDKYPIEWIIAGHGSRVRLPAADIKLQLSDLVYRMRRQ